MERKPMVACTYGWGKALKLYQDHLDLNGIAYRLNDLLFIHPIPLCVMGIPSVRLEMHFKQGVIMLRGIAALNEAYALVEYIDNRNAARTASHPRRSITAINTPGAASIALGPTETPVAPATSSITEHRYWDYSPGIPKTIQSLQEYSQAPTTPIEYEKDAWESLPHSERLPKHVRIDPTLREEGFAVKPIADRRHAEKLPQFQVPLHLLPEEYAHYCTRATLYSEPPGGSPDYRYRVIDRGTLILTNMRLIYLGRKRQIVLNYERLLRVTHRQDAFAFQAEHWSRPELFNVRHPQEFIMYLEYILQKSQSAYAGRGSMEYAH